MAVRFEDLDPLTRRQIKLARTTEQPAPARAVAHRPAPVQGNDETGPFVCLAPGCDFESRYWETTQRHARTEHGCARIEQLRTHPMNLDLFGGMPSLKGAACIGADPAVFESSHATTAAQRDEARAICAGCPVLEACLGYALANPSATEGAMWGGLTPTERRKHRDRRRGGGNWQIHLLQPHGTEAAYARHMRSKERPCESCRKAHNEYFRLRKQARRTATEVASHG